ncbi:MAG: Gfo/Idh/MocA family oxidoreductase [Bacteroidota bacterium]
MENHLNRRNFIKKTSMLSAGIGAASILPSRVWGAKAAPSDQVNVALIGCRSRGFGSLKDHLSFGETNCVAMCDVDQNLLEERAAEIKKTYGDTPKLYKDFRKMLEQDDIDVVIVGTPDHWHCLNTVYALQAGKDVYVEKPMANTIEECNIMARAANYYNGIVQVGQQQRSNPVFIEVMKLIKAGTIGSLRKVNMWANFNYGLGVNPAMDEPVPQGVDYNMWLGPAPNRPFNTNHFHGSWRHFWNYGGGMFSDWGVHLVDMGLWAKDQVQGPTQVLTYAENSSSFEKKRDTFDTQTAIFPMKDYVISYEMIAGVEKGPYPLMYGVAFIGDKATIKANRSSYEIIPEWDSEKKANMVEPVRFEKGQEAHALHVRNFLDCVKTRQTPACPPEVGRAGALHVHASNISARIGEPHLVWDDRLNKFTNSEKANSFIVPEYRAPWTLPVIG